MSETPRVECRDGAERGVNGDNRLFVSVPGLGKVIEVDIPVLIGKKASRVGRLPLAIQTVNGVPVLFNYGNTDSRVTSSYDNIGLPISPQNPLVVSSDGRITTLTEKELKILGLDPVHKIIMPGGSALQVGLSQGKQPGEDRLVFGCVDTGRPEAMPSVKTEPSSRHHNASLRAATMQERGRGGSVSALWHKEDTDQPTRSEKGGRFLRGQRVDFLSKDKTLQHGVVLRTATDTGSVLVAYVDVRNGEVSTKEMAVNKTGNHGSVARVLRGGAGQQQVEEVIERQSQIPMVVADGLPVMVRVEEVGPSHTKVLNPETNDRYSVRNEEILIMAQLLRTSEEIVSVFKQMDDLPEGTHVYEREVSGATKTRLAIDSRGSSVNVLKIGSGKGRQEYSLVCLFTGDGYNPGGRMAIRNWIRHAMRISMIRQDGRLNPVSVQHEMAELGLRVKFGEYVVDDASKDNSVRLVFMGGQTGIAQVGMGKSGVLDAVTQERSSSGKITTSYVRGGRTEDTSWSGMQQTQQGERTATVLGNLGNLPSIGPLQNILRQPVPEGEEREVIKQMIKAGVSGPIVVVTRSKMAN